MPRTLLGYIIIKVWQVWLTHLVDYEESQIKNFLFKLNINMVIMQVPNQAMLQQVGWSVSMCQSVCQAVMSELFCRAYGSIFKLTI